MRTWWMLLLMSGIAQAIPPGWHCIYTVNSPELVYLPLSEKVEKDCKLTPEGAAEAKRTNAYCIGSVKCERKGFPDVFTLVACPSIRDSCLEANECGNAKKISGISTNRAITFREIKNVPILPVGTAVKEFGPHEDK